MTKLNIYRACLLICLAAIVYVWPIAALLIGAWWAFALIGLLAKRSLPSNGERSTSEIVNTESLGALSAWLGVWNGFYVWKDLDPDYWSRSRDQ
jgi:hypothetical protein